MLYQQQDLQVQSAINKTLDQAGGQILLELSGSGPDGASGTGSLVTLMFEAITAHPQTQVVVGRVAPGGPGGETLAATPPHPHVIAVVP